MFSKWILVLLVAASAAQQFPPLTYVMYPAMPIVSYMHQPLVRFVREPLESPPLQSNLGLPQMIPVLPPEPPATHAPNRKKKPAQHTAAFSNKTQNVKTTLRPPSEATASVNQEVTTNRPSVNNNKPNKVTPTKQPSSNRPHSEHLTEKPVKNTEFTTSKPVPQTTDYSTITEKPTQDTRQPVRLTEQPIKLTEQYTTEYPSRNTDQSPNNQTVGHTTERNNSTEPNNGPEEASSAGTEPPRKPCKQSPHVPLLPDDDSSTGRSPNSTDTGGEGTHNSTMGTDCEEPGVVFASFSQVPNRKGSGGVVNFG